MKNDISRPDPLPHDMKAPKLVKDLFDKVTPYYQIPYTEKVKADVVPDVKVNNGAVEVTIQIKIKF